MKLFYSWQSDRHEKTGRYFIRSVLEQALSELKKDVEFEEAERLELDQDTKGVPGSPNIAETILAKIRESAVFIADVTPVGVSPEGKALTNPNVAIELGYALSIVGDDGLLTILNQAYGGREGLPFDLKHKRGPYQYTLGEDADAASIRSAKKSLCDLLKPAIRAIVELKTATAKAALPFDEAPATINRGQYFARKEVLADWGGPGEMDDKKVGFNYPPGACLYLRMIPVTRTPQLSVKETADGFTFQVQHLS